MGDTYLIDALLFIMLIAIIYLGYYYLSALGEIIEIREAIYKADKEKSFINNINNEEARRILDSQKYYYAAKLKKAKK